MKRINYLSVILFSFSLFTNCSSAQKLQANAPLNFGAAEFQTWVAGVKGGGSGINLYIPVLEASETNIKLDSVYFRGKVATLELLQDESNTYVARFKGEFNQIVAISINTDKSLEGDGKNSEIVQKIPFDLKDSECVISYKKGGEIQYFKIENISEKPPVHYPSVRPNRQ